LRRCAGILLGLALLLLAAAPASAQVTQVTVTRFDDPPPGDCATDGCTLREAIPRFDPNVEVILPSSAQDYVLNSELGIGIHVTIRGPSTGLATIRLDAAAPQSSVFSIGTNLNVTMSNLRITDGRNDDSGGGIEVNDGATLNLVDSEVAGNRAANGAGIYGHGSTTLNLERSTVAGNTATGGAGGGVYVEGTATLTNSTVSGNTATRGGGLYASGGLSLQNTTVAGNGGGGLHSTTGQVAMRSTLLAGNAGGACSGQPGTGLDEYNLADDATCSLDGTGDRVAGALLAPLGDYGGPTRTQALYTGSPAIDAVPGGCLPVDQRQVARTSPCDIGAFEGSIAGGPPPGDQLPLPVAGKSVNAVPVRGTVRVKLPGRRRFRVLAEGEQIPVGTTVDTLKGRVTITAAGGQSADFYGGIFRIAQTKSARPLTTLRLVEKLSCGKRGKASVAAKRKKKRRLWGDGSGKFRTEGSYSSATVRGTKWLVEDRCSSTLTRVAKGRVAVRDFVKRKTVIVRAGKRYVAKRRGG
jgi:predicted outer membrane repeat protein